MLNEIKKIIWHEIGHLCVDIILIQRISFENFYINELQIFKIPRLSENCWGGQVEILPDIGYERSVQNLDYLTLKLITLTSGCIFETLFSTEFLKEKCLNFENCFGMNHSCKGRGDFNKYNELISRLIADCDKKEGKIIRGNSELVNFIYSYIPKTFLEIVQKNKSFLTSVGKEVDKLAQLVKLDFENQNKPDNYCYKINSSELNSLLNIFRKIILKDKFEDNLNIVYDRFHKTLLPHF